jgi:hypothetical protein
VCRTKRWKQNLSIASGIFKNVAVRNADGVPDGFPDSVRRHESITMLEFYQSDHSTTESDAI